MKQKNLPFIVLGLIVALILIINQFPNLIQLGAINSNALLKLAIPVNGAYSCQYIGSASPDPFVITSNGIWISKDAIGAYTDKVDNIKVVVTQNAWDNFIMKLLLGGQWIEYKTCDQNKNSCTAIQKQNLAPGDNVLNLRTSSINPLTTSLFVQVKAGSLLGSSSSISNSGMTLSYSFSKYGLKYVSSSTNPAGTLFGGCESSCDLTCPKQKSKSDTGLIYTTSNSLLPGDSAPVFEYWNPIDYDLNMQGGATIYNKDKNEFCFGGIIYEGNTIKMQSGITYIYPDAATRDKEECCPGAVISTGQENKICQSDYTWKTLAEDTKIKCISDYNCPGQGQFTCQNKVRSGYGCGVIESDGNRYCTTNTVSTPVQCCSQADCAADQTCQDYKCVGGASGQQISLTNSSNNGLVGGTCQWYQDSKQGNDLVYKWYNYIGIGEPTSTPYQTCTTAPWVYLAIVGLIVLLIVYANKNRRKR